MRKLLTMGIILIMVLTFSACSQAGQYDKEGKKYFKKEFFDKAADCFRKAIKENPNCSDYYIDYGMALIALGKQKEAITQFEAASLNKDMSIVRENNKRACRGKGIAYYNMKDYSMAVMEFENALAINELPGLDVDILYYIGRTYCLTGAYEKALMAYTEIISKQRKSAEAYAARAYCYKKLDIGDKSLADYDRAIKLEPDNYEYYFEKYNMLMESNSKDKAETVLVQAEEIKAVTEEDKYNLARLHFYRESYDTAIKELESSFANGFYEAYYYIGEIYRMNRDYKKALYYYNQFIDTGKEHTPNVYNQAAVCLIKMNDYEEAVKYLKKGIALGTSDSIKVLKKNEIIAYEYLGEFDTAKNKLKGYLLDFPKDKEAVREAEFIDTRTKDFVIN